MSIYPNLDKLGLASYMGYYCYGDQNREPHKNKFLTVLDNYLNDLSKDSLNALRLKFRSNLSLEQQDDFIKELCVAVVFHPMAKFIQESNKLKTPDLIDQNLKIEVKYLKESLDEQIRHRSDKFFSIKGILSDEKKAAWKTYVLEAVKKKANEHLVNACLQIEQEGLIYLIYDYDNFFEGGTRVVEKEEVYSQILKSIEDFLENNRGVEVRTIYQGDLTSLVEGIHKFETI